MKKELELILLAVLRNRTEHENNRIVELVKEKLDWGYIFGQIMHHRMGGYFLQGLTSDQQKQIFPEARKSLQLMMKAQRQQTNEISNIILPILQDIEEAGIRYAGLKGLLFNATLYKPGERRSNDTDLLVLEQDLDKLDQVLRRHGYIQSLLPNGEFVEASRREKMIQRLNYHDLVPYVKSIGSDFVDCHEIDINFHFDSKDNDITGQVIEYGLERYTYGEHTFYGLVWETNLAHLCVHFYREGTSSIWSNDRRDVVLYKIIDVVNTLRLNQDAEKLRKWVQLMETLQLKKAGYYTLYYVNQLYAGLVPEEIINGLQPEDISYVDEIEVVGEHKKIKREQSFFEVAFNLEFKYTGV